MTETEKRIAALRKQAEVMRKQPTRGADCHIVFDGHGKRVFRPDDLEWLLARYDESVKKIAELKKRLAAANKKIKRMRDGNE